MEKFAPIDLTILSLRKQEMSLKPQKESVLTTEKARDCSTK